MLHAARTKLLTALSEERMAVRGFVELLQQERRLLIENSIDRLLLLAEQKSAYAQRLNELTETRRRLLEKLIPALDNAGIQAWFENNSHEGLALWQAVLVLAEEARQFNDINGELILMKQRHNQQLLTALTRAVSQANLYGPDGQTNFSPGSGRSLGSV